MKILSSPEAAYQESLRWKQTGNVALVPTMGALHEGHLALVRMAKQLASRVIVSIFVNPLQFGPNEDFNRYPRAFEEDCRKLKDEGVDLLFAPTATEFYPEGFSTRVSVSALAEHLCGRSRPGHFEGVATVCLKLFQSTAVDFAVFGEKDFQQLRVLEQMVTDLNLPLKVVPHPIVREADGLAMSSRNRYLSADERAWAGLIPKALKAAQVRAQTLKDLTAGELIKLVRNDLSAAPLRIEYCEIASEKDLVPQRAESPLESMIRPRLLLAVKNGTTRLIDNLSLLKEGA